MLLEFVKKEDAAAHHRRANVLYRECDRLIIRYDLYLNLLFSLTRERNSGFTFWQDTPNPGAYHLRDFIEEADLNPVKKTYGFKSVSRKAPTLGTQRGQVLLPGAYDFPNSDVLTPSFFFKTCPRRDITLGVRDKVGLGLERYWS